MATKLKRILSFVLAVLMVAGFTACSSTKSPATESPTTGSSSPADSSTTSTPVESKTQEPVTVTVWDFAMSDEKIQAREAVIEQFEKENPNITIDFLGTPDNPNLFIQKLDMALAAGAPPDVGIYLNPSYIERGAIEPLDNYFSNSYLKDVIPEGITNAVRSVDQKEGKLYGILGYVYPNTLWVRTDWFKEAGLPIPETWDQFFNAAEKLTDKSKNRYGYSIRGGSGSAINLEYMMYAYSGITNYFTEDGKCTLNDKLHVEFVEKYLGGYGKYTPDDDLSKGFTELQATFQSGIAAMIAHNSGSATSHDIAFEGDRTKFQMLKFPTGLNGVDVHSAPRTEAAFTISIDSKVKNEAWKYLEFVMQAEQIWSYCKVANLIPTNSKSMELEDFKNDQFAQEAAAIMFGENMKYYDNPYWLPEYTTVQTDYAEPALQEVMAGKLTAKEFLDEWAARLEAGLAEYKAKN
jgi:multiple sugar transport system substrate-binding protein